MPNFVCYKYLKWLIGQTVNGSNGQWVKRSTWNIMHKWSHLGLFVYFFLFCIILHVTFLIFGMVRIFIIRIISWEIIIYIFQFFFLFQIILDRFLNLSQILDKDFRLSWDFRLKKTRISAHVPKFGYPTIRVSTVYHLLSRHQSAVAVSVKEM